MGPVLGSFLAVVLLLLVGIPILLLVAYFPVPQGHVVLIERFGKYHRTLEAGINFVVPLIEKPCRLTDWRGVACKNDVHLELAEQHTDTPPRTAITKDNVEVDADASVYWQVIDPPRARYEVDRLPEAINDMALNLLRTGIGSLTLDQALVERQRLNQYLLSHLTKACDKWGTRIVRVEIQTLRPSAGGAGEAMLKEMSAERERRALILRATGEKEATLLRAAAEQEAMVLRAKGEAQSLLLRTNAELERLEKLTDLLGKPRGAEAAVALRYLEALEAMAKDPASKLFLGASTASSASLAGLLASMPDGDRRGPVIHDSEVELVAEP